MQRRYALSVPDFDQQAAVVAGAPLPDAVHGAHLHPLVEAARGEDVVELIVACRLWILTREVTLRDSAARPSQASPLAVHLASVAP